MRISLNTGKRSVSLNFSREPSPRVAHSRERHVSREWATRVRMKFTSGLVFRVSFFIWEGTISFFRGGGGGLAYEKPYLNWPKTIHNIALLGPVWAPFWAVWHLFLRSGFTVFKLFIQFYPTCFPVLQTTMPAQITHIWKKKAQVWGSSEETWVFSAVNFLPESKFSWFLKA